MDKIRLTPEQITAMESIISKGDRVELIPVKDRVKVVRVRREEITKSREEIRVS